MIRKWLQERRARRAAKRLDAGYNYAAGRLLAGHPVSDLRGKVQESRDFGAYDEFDEGIELAITHWKKRFTK